MILGMIVIPAREAGGLIINEDQNPHSSSKSSSLHLTLQGSGGRLARVNTR